MQVTIEEISPVEKKLAVQIPWPQVALKLDHAYRDLGRKVSLKGFRRGKVPRQMLEKLYRQEVERDVMNDLLRESFYTAAVEHKIKMVADPVVDDLHLDPGKSFHYSARVPVQAEIVAKDYRDIPLKSRKAAVKDEDIDTVLKRRQRELSTLKPIESRSGQTAKAGQVLTVNMTGHIVDGATEGTTPEPRPLSLEKAKVEIGTPQGLVGGAVDDEQAEMNEPIPGMGKAMLGMPLDAINHPIKFQIPQLPAAGEEAAKNVARTVELAVTVVEAHDKEIPALDDDFAAESGDATTLVELKEKIREKLLAAEEAEVKRELKEALKAELLKRNSFAVAPALVERRLDGFIYRSRLEMLMRGVDYRQLPGDRLKELEARMRDNMRETAHDSVRAELLLDAIATIEKIDVSNAELDKRIGEIAEARGKAAQKVKADLQKENEIESVKLNLREEKTLDMLLDCAKIEKNT